MQLAQTFLVIWVFFGLVATGFSLTDAAASKNAGEHPIATFVAFIVFFVGGPITFGMLVREKM